MMSWFAAIALGAATTGGAHASIMSGFGGDIPRYAIVPGFWTVWFGPPMPEETQEIVYFGVNTAFWACAWRACPSLARLACMAIAADTAIGFGARFLPRK